MKKCRDWRALVAVAALFLVSPGVLYVGAYYTLVRPAAINMRSMRAHISPGYPPCALVDCYRLFGPMHAIDRRLRPNFWLRRIDPAVFLSATADDVAAPSPEQTP